MTNEEFQKALAAIIDAVECGNVEYRTRYDDDDCWQPMTDLHFLPRVRYRLKPQPREVWIHEGDIGNALSMADGPARSSNFRKFREVIE